MKLLRRSENERRMASLRREGHIGCIMTGTESLLSRSFSHISTCFSMHKDLYRQQRQTHVHHIMTSIQTMGALEIFTLGVHGIILKIILKMIKKNVKFRIADKLVSRTARGRSIHSQRLGEVGGWYFKRDLMLFVFLCI